MWGVTFSRHTGLYPKFFGDEFDNKKHKKNENNNKSKSEEEAEINLIFFLLE